MICPECEDEVIELWAHLMQVAVEEQITKGVYEDKTYIVKSTDLRGQEPRQIVAPGRELQITKRSRRRSVTNQDRPESSSSKKSIDEL